MSAPTWNNEEEFNKIADKQKLMDHNVFAEMVKDKGKVFYIGMVNRPGVMTLFSLVEYYEFHPEFGPKPNDDFNVGIIEWKSIPFFVFWVPVTFEDRVKELAEAIHMRIVDGTPLLLMESGADWFPGSKDGEKNRNNMFTIENTSGSMIYTNRKNLQDSVLEREAILGHSLMRFGGQVPLKFIDDFLWGVDQATTKQ